MNNLNLNKIFNKKITIKEWEENRRGQILSIFENEVFGRINDEDIEISFNVLSIDNNALNNTAIMKEVEISLNRFGNSLIFPLYLFTPSNNKKSPVFLTICNKEIDKADPSRNNISQFWPVEQIISKGYGTATFLTSDITSNGLNINSSGIYQLFPELIDKQNSFGTVSVWAYCASKALDYLITDEDVNEEKIIIVGHSNGGKAALWSAAKDQRFCMAISNCSGCDGASIDALDKVESIKNITDKYPYLFCNNYKKYRYCEQELKVNQHMLLALIAKRPLYISSKTQDFYSNLEYEACVFAHPIYKLYGQHSIKNINEVRNNIPIKKGMIGYHRLSGKKELNSLDWHYFLDFADLKL